MKLDMKTVGAMDLQRNDLVIVADTAIFADLRGKVARVEGRYLQTGSYGVITLNDAVTLPRHDLVKIPASYYQHLVDVPPPLPDVEPKPADGQVTIKNGVITFNGEQLIPAAKLIEVAHEFAAQYGMREEITELFTALEIEAPDRHLRIEIEIPESKFLEPNRKDRDWRTWSNETILETLATAVIDYMDSTTLNATHVTITALEE